MTSVHVETDCSRPNLRSLQVLPNHHIGYILECLRPNNQTIQEIDSTTNRSVDIYEESSIRWLGRFSYSPNMKEIILVDVNGLYLESSLYYLDVDGERKNITPGFQRADFPAWSPTKDIVAFLGTKPYSGSDNPKSWNQIDGLLDYPWKMYMYHPRSGEIEEFSIEIVHPGRLKWSPNGKLLAFTGRYKGVPGVWIIETQNNLRVTRVITEIASFDFSPDSKSLAYVGQTSVETQNAIYIVDLYGLFQDR